LGLLAGAERGLRRVHSRGERGRLAGARGLELLDPEREVRLGALARLEGAAEVVDLRLPGLELLASVFTVRRDARQLLGEPGLERARPGRLLLLRGLEQREHVAEAPDLAGALLGLGADARELGLADVRFLLELAEPGLAGLELLDAGACGAELALAGPD